jgi:hypothetical protein
MLLGSSFTFGFRIDLQGLASAVVLGLGLSSCGLCYLVLKSQWDALASSFNRQFLKEQATEEKDLQENVI